MICTYETKRFYKPDFVTSFLCPECGARVRFLCHSCHALEPRFRRLTKRKVARRARVCAKCRRGQPGCLVDCPQEKVETERKKLATMRDKRLREGLPRYGCLKCRDVPAGCAKCRALVHISSPFPHTSMLYVDLKQTVESLSL